MVNRGAPGWLTLLAAEMYEVLDFLYDDQEVLQALVGEVARDSGRPLFLRALPEEIHLHLMRSTRHIAVKASWLSARPWLTVDSTRPILGRTGGPSETRSALGLTAGAAHCGEDWPF